MGDLFLHLGFARRLRFADGLHPVVVETLVRQPAPVVAAATLPLLPNIEHKSASLFRRLLGRGKAESARWARQLGVENPPRGELLVALLKKRSAGPGQMTRLSLALGALSHTVLETCIGDITSGLEGAERQAVERGQARLWLQLAVPSLRDLAREWSAAAALDDTDRVRRALEQLDVALREVHGDAPGVDTLARWGRALAAETASLEERAALPPEGAMPEHEVRARYFEGDAAFLEKAQRAIQWFVYLANEIGGLCVGAEPSEEAIRQALCDEGGALRALPDDFDVEASRAAWQANLQALQSEHLLRGRNPKPAYYASYARGDGAPPLPPLPDDDSGAVPTSTQEISAADIEDELPTPAMTQEISAADIEEEAEDAPPLQAPAMTQEISAADIEDEIESQKPPPAPTSTQQISAADIEEELAAAPDEATEPAPTSTQQIAAADIEEELAAEAGPEPQAQPDVDASPPVEAAPPSDALPASGETPEAPPPEDNEPRAALDEGFPAPPHTPPLGTLPADAPPPPAVASSSSPSTEARTRTPPLGTPISHVNGVGHDDERASVDEGQATEDSSNRSA